MITRAVKIMDENASALFSFDVQNPLDGDPMKILIARECRSRVQATVSTPDEPNPKVAFEKWQQEGDMWQTTIDTHQGPFYIEAQLQR